MKEVPARIACLVVLAGLLFNTNVALLGMCVFSTTIWLLVKSTVGTITEVEIMQMLVMTPSDSFVTKLAATKVHISSVSIPNEKTSQSTGSAHIFYRLAVLDNGCGMSVDTTRKMFDPYFTTKQTGHGFGLSIVQGIARSHNATVSVQSEPGSGTTISLMFHAAPVADQGTLSTMETANQSVERLSSKVVLLIDDDPLVRSSFAAMLYMLGWEIVEADCGEAAVSLLSIRNDFMAVVIDYSMPKMNGRETLRALRAQGCQAPAVLCSGYTGSDDDSSANDEFAAMLQKPFRAVDLNAILIKLEQDANSKGH